jgi:cytochrome b involved in lipid metabolism
MDPADLSRDTSFTVEEIAKHNTETDCWLNIYDQVYDASSFVKEHPGNYCLF